MKLAMIGFVCLLPMMAQDVKIPASIEKLADKASEVVDVTLDASLLQLAAKFLPANDPDTAQVKRLVSGLKGVYVRSFQFDKPGEYQASDVESIRSQLRGPNWARIVGVRKLKSGEHSEVYLRTEGGSITGLAVIAAEPKELTIVNINGPIRPEDLQELGGHFGIPKLDGESGRKNDSGKKDE
ncbi:MAG: DUF4252 domain-containing protein [Acidobacteria bacterium]|nr:DUF4252 domain-containing protein [Acidobacteriota bacterium]